MKSNCQKCIYMQPIAGDCHISCRNPDPKMTGIAHGVNNGWFFYPMAFDPIWMGKECSHFTTMETLREGIDTLVKLLWSSINTYTSHQGEITEQEAEIFFQLSKHESIQKALTKLTAGP